MDSDPIKENLTNKTRPKIKWLFKGLLFIVLPVIILVWLNISLWNDCINYGRSLDDKKAVIPELNTKIAASALSQIVGEIQSKTDALARQLSEKNISILGDALKREMDEQVKTMAQLTIACEFSGYAKTVDGHNKTLQDRLQCQSFYSSKDSDEEDNSNMPSGERNPNKFKVSVYGSAIAMADNSLINNDSGRWATYIYRSPDGLVYNRTLNEVDYTDRGNPMTAWYHEPVRINKSLWVDPYLDDLGDTYMITYSSPIKSGKGIIGVVTADVSIEQLKHVIETLINGYDGFGALTNSRGVYIYHPEHDYVKEKKTLIDIAKLKNDKDRFLVESLSQKGESGRISHISTTTGEKSWLVVEPVMSSLWSLQNTFYKDSFYSVAETNQLRRQKIYLITASIFLAAWMMALVINMLGWSVHSIWGLSIIVSVMLAVGIGNIWDLALNHTKPKNSEDEVVDSVYAIDTRINNYIGRLNGSKRTDPEIVVIPTGVYIQTIELKNANSVNISGRVWQVFNNYCDCDRSTVNVASQRQASELKPCCDCNGSKSFDQESGVQFGGAKNVKFTQLPDEIDEGCGVVKSWWFQADIVSTFDYSRYPLEVEYLDLHILPKSAKNNVLLVPDVKSYQFDSNRKAGLSSDIFIPGWNVFRSYFTLKDPDNNRPTFGMVGHFDDEEFDELHFKVGLKRIFIDAFISNLTPLIVVAIILFSVALLPVTIDISRVLGICVSVFFVVVFAHLAIRRSISSEEIFYLEYFYFAIYLALLLVPVDAFRETLGIKSRVFEYKNGILYKMLYWPSLLAVFYLVTAVKFI